MWFSRFRAAALAVLLFGIAGCGGSKAPKLSCPTPLIAPNLDTAQVFRPGGNGAEDLRYNVKLVLVNSSCQSESEGGLSADPRMTFIVSRNDPSLASADFTYFVAIADARQTILEKREFSLRVEFPARQNQMKITDQIHVGLPVRDIATGSNYAIIVGLELTPEQVEFNRRRSAAQ
jgi:hypothetical protein